MGYFYWGEENNPRRQQAPTGRFVDVNPRSVTPLHAVNSPGDRAAIEHYRRHPNRSLDGGVPWVKVGVFGGRLLQNGHHRRQAAIESGRRLRVWIPGR